VKKGLEEKNAEGKQKRLETEIKESRNHVVAYSEEENKLLTEIKFLSTIREKMARTAS